MICDTSFLILLATKRIKNIASLDTEIGSLDFVVPSAVTDELQRLLEKKDKTTEAQEALKLVKNFKKIPIHGKNVDSAIIQYIKENGGFVATMDKELKSQVKKNKGSIISLSNDRVVLE